MGKSLRWAGCAMVLVAAVACNSNTATGGTAFVDDRQDTVRVRVPASRVVSLLPATTELLFAIDAGASVVGRSSWDDTPVEALRVPAVGAGLMERGSSIDRVAALRPDVVLIDPSPINDAAVAQLRTIGIPTLRLRVYSFDDLERVTDMLGRLVGRSDQAGRVWQTLRQQLDSASTAPASNAPRIAIVGEVTPPIIIGRGSFLSDMVRLVGGVNVFEDVSEPSIATTIEEIAKRNPTHIWANGIPSKALTSSPAWRAIPAVAANRVFIVRTSAASWPSPRMPDAVRALSTTVASTK